MDIRPSDKDASKIEKKVESSVSEPHEEHDQVLEGATHDAIAEIAVNQVLEIENESEKAMYKDDIKLLVDWAKSKVDDETSPMEIKWAIRDLGLKISTPVHEDRIKHLSRFAYLDLEEQRIKREKRMSY